MMFTSTEISTRTAQPWLHVAKWKIFSVVQKKHQIVWGAYNNRACLDKVILLSPKTLQLLTEIRVIKNAPDSLRKPLGLQSEGQWFCIQHFKIISALPGLLRRAWKIPPGKGTCVTSFMWRSPVLVVSAWRVRLRSEPMANSNNPGNIRRLMQQQMSSFLSNKAERRPSYRNISLLILGGKKIPNATLIYFLALSDVPAAPRC